MDLERFVENYWEECVEELGEYKAQELFDMLSVSDLLDRMDDYAKGWNQMKTVQLNFRDTVAIINVIRTLQTEIDVRDKLQEQSFRNSTESTIRDLTDAVEQLKDSIEYFSKRGTVARQIQKFLSKN